MSQQQQYSQEHAQQGLNIGFIGFGTIASSIATGIAKQTQVPIQSMTVTRRSQAKSTALQKDFPALTTITDDVQVIIDRATDFIFLCLLPETLQSVLQTVSFHNNSTATVISVVANSNLPDIAQWTQLPLARLAKMICTPSIAHHQGVSLLLPGMNSTVMKEDQDSSTLMDTDKEEKKVPETLEHATPSSISSSSSTLAQLLEATGGMVSCKSPQHMNILMTPFCAMGPIYGLLRQHQQWLVQQGGIDPSTAQTLITKQYHAIVYDALSTTATTATIHDNTPTTTSSSSSDRLQELIDEQTPNGLNEQALRQWTNLGALDSYTQVLNSMVDRLEGGHTS